MRSHGTVGKYRNEGCRCDACKAAKTEAGRVWRAKRREKVATGEVLIPHGTWNAYCNYQCRCEACLTAGRAYIRSRQHLHQAHRRWRLENDPAYAQRYRAAHRAKDQRRRKRLDQQAAAYEYVMARLDALLAEVSELSQSKQVQ